MTERLPAPKPQLHLRPPAKINLGLHILGKRPDGYHNLESLMLPVPQLADELTLSPEFDAPVPVLLLSGRPLPGNPAENIVVQAWQRLKQQVPHLPPVRIRLHKHIPAGAGLGGGSSNAASMLLGLNQLFDLKLPLSELEALARPLGADVPFFLHNQPMLATGIGHDLAPFPWPHRFRIQLVLPPVHSDTALAYRGLKLEDCRSEVPLEHLLAAPPETWRMHVQNHFEPSVFGRFPQLRRMKEALYAQGAVYASMSGSGSALYGLFAV